MSKNESKLERQAREERQKQLSNPGKANKERKKEMRGETFVGKRPVTMDSKKQKSNSRQSIKNDTRKRYHDYDDER